MSRAVPRKKPDAFCDMTVSRLTTDPLTQLPILILKDASGDEALPIWIGLPEASAIAAELEHIAYERPLTHDLLKIVLGEAGMRVDSVEVTDVKNQTFFAAIYLRKPLSRKRVKIDSRPSDAIALAMRCGAPIRVARRVLDRARRIDLREPAEAPDSIEDTPELADILASLADEDFGKWKM